MQIGPALLPLTPFPRSPPGQVGLDVWLRDGNVFTCWSSMWDVIWHGELGSSLALLNAGFGLDCFMMRYQGVDWADSANWKCNKQ